MLVLDGVEAKLKEAKAGDMVTKAKLKVCQLMCGYSRSTVTLKVCLPPLKLTVFLTQEIDEQNSGFVSYSHFLARFFHWMDPDLDDI